MDKPVNAGPANAEKGARIQMAELVISDVLSLVKKPCRGGPTYRQTAEEKAWNQKNHLGLSASVPFRYSGH